MATCEGKSSVKALPPIQHALYKIYGNVEYAAANNDYKYPYGDCILKFSHHCTQASFLES